ncbi:hypothetical protein CCACVL1_19539 [Corchorus capsularis]|uniref:Uncharacterized protein n=1 Tax=Corchorus capsularis TaxID=210143 RepID=A0A1R3HG79_COCAP|nr:hypothetical protein CCACVL1_19539 [Corchorus capsularis]
MAPLKTRLCSFLNSTAEDRVRTAVVAIQSV